MTDVVATDQRNAAIEKWLCLPPSPYCTLQVEPPRTHVWRNAAGDFHRVDADGNQDGPAIIYDDGNLLWCVNGENHRLDGPAWVSPSGDQSWYLDDHYMSKEEWAQDPRVIAYHSQTQEEAESWLKNL